MTARDPNPFPDTTHLEKLFKAATQRRVEEAYAKAQMCEHMIPGAQASSAQTLEELRRFMRSMERPPAYLKRERRFVSATHAHVLRSNGVALPCPLPPRGALVDGVEYIPLKEMPGPRYGLDSLLHSS